MTRRQAGIRDALVSENFRGCACFHVSMTKESAQNE